MKSTVTFKEFFFKEDVTADSALGGSGAEGYMPSGNIYSGPGVYAPGDARVPKLLKKGIQTRFGSITGKKRKKRRKIRKKAKG